MLQKAVLEGTGKAAQIKDFTVAGKTGTAQKYSSSQRGYSSTAHTASFVGFAPAKKPVVSMIVVIDDPKGKYYGGQVAAPVFGEVTSSVLRYLGIPYEKEPHEMIIAEYPREAGAK
jgi:cell division protein FtsI (penicillin-binding protein 3)